MELEKLGKLVLITGGKPGAEKADWQNNWPEAGDLLLIRHGSGT